VIPKECKRLAEVDFPIAAVSAHSAREKSIRHGHPSTLHLWWARRPLAACRSMLMALLLPDPCDPHCPVEFKRQARAILKEHPGYMAPTFQEMLKTNEGLRKLILHEFIADFANWDNAANPAFLKTARAMVKAAHGEEAPLVVDPFAGGGSIPLEALRVGCDAFASDLNPVACLINKVLLEDIPRHGPKLAEELRRVGAEIKKQAEKELAEFYPPDPDGARPIAYLWARTVRCEQPNCGCEIPLVRSFWLCTKPSRKRALSYEIVRGRNQAPALQFAITSPRSASDVVAGTVARAKATCPACNRVLGPDRVRSQLREQHGGADPIFDKSGNRVGGAQVLATVTLSDNQSGRQYRLPTKRDYDAVFCASRYLEHARRSVARGGHNPEPDEPLPLENTNCFRVPNYGVRQWHQLFNLRQRASLAVLGAKVRAMRDEGQAKPIDELAAIVVNRCADASSSHSAWRVSVECNRATFARQALSMVWDYCESVTTTDAAGGYDGALEWVAEVVEEQGKTLQKPGQVQNADATESPLPDGSAAVWFTDPPYYDAVGYAELSDFFFVWLKRSLPNHQLLRDRFDSSNPLVPKTRECVQDESYSSVDGHPKDKRFFETTMARAFDEGRRATADSGIGCVVFAHKTTEGWEALLTGMIRGGWVITGSWPISTERPGRLRAQDSAALATSIHLLCRPRDDDAGVGDWGDIVRDLPKRIGDWMERLGDEGIRGADLVFACIGPALELFSKHARVETPDGEDVGLAANDRARGEPARRGFLSYVWEFAGRTALNQVLGSAESRARNGAAGALEEDARLTALFLWTLQATEAAANGKAGKKAAEVEDDDANGVDEGDDEDTGEDSGATQKGKKKAGLSLIYDVARRFAQPLGIHLDIWEGRIIETAKGVVRLLPVGERAKQLFGEDEASAVARRFDSAKKPDPQGMLDFMAEQRAVAVPEVKGRGRKKKDGTEASPESLRAKREATTLDRVHAAMLLHDSGATNALRALLEAEVERGPDFLRLANALSALYPRDSEEKRLLDAMLLAVPR